LLGLKIAFSVARETFGLCVKVSSFGSYVNYLCGMKLHGSILENLESALASGRRLRGRPVYKETLAYWEDLLREATRAVQDPTLAQSDALRIAIAKLEIELADRLE
jgi:hypothetical protein